MVRDRGPEVSPAVSGEEAMRRWWEAETMRWREIARQYREGALYSLQVNEDFWNETTGEIVPRLIRRESESSEGVDSPIDSQLDSIYQGSHVVGGPWEGERYERQHSWEHGRFFPEWDCPTCEAFRERENREARDVREDNRRSNIENAVRPVITNESIKDRDKQERISLEVYQIVEIFHATEEDLLDAIKDLKRRKLL